MEIFSDFYLFIKLFFLIQNKMNQKYKAGCVIIYKLQPHQEYNHFS